MAEHRLKTWPEPYEALVSEIKRWEYRKDDRNFQVGDVLVLEWWNPAPGPYDYSPAQGYDYDHAPGPGRRSIERKVTYIIHGGRFDIPVGYCVMSIVPLGEVAS